MDFAAVAAAQRSGDGGESTRPLSTTDRVAATDVEVLRQLMADAQSILASLPPEASQLEKVTGAEMLRAKRAQEHRTRMDQLEQKAKERWWYDIVHERKEGDRRRAAEEAEAAARAAWLAANPPDTPRTIKRKSEQQAARARAEMIEAQKQQYLDAEWAPTLARNRQQNRAKRAEAERAMAEALATARAAAEREMQEHAREEVERQREASAMASEDAASASFLSTAAAECGRLSAQPVDPMAVAAAVRVLTNPSRELWWRLQDMKQARELEEKQRRLQQQREDHDYRQWRDQVRSARCRESRLEARRWEPHKDADVKWQLELRGRDYLREREVEQQARLNDLVKSSSSRALNVELTGSSPKNVLQEARSKAKQQRDERHREAPIRAEQAFWEQQLAKTRLARQQDLSTPRAQKQRWGLLGSG